jgi:hypothetical protein
MQFLLAFYATSTKEGKKKLHNITTGNKNSEADSFRKKSKISYTPEDGHVGRNM